VLEAFIGDVDVTSANNDGDTALHLAAKYNNDDDDGDTALHLAAKNGHVDAVKLLLQKSRLDARTKYTTRRPHFH